ncbi:MAG TPA: hypothetical protein PLD20_12520 [Blastocatellia bacterium]|nr:hypothetical protein [Blastocatellia bacterium]HMV86849.1 hypothetical protein [Blastocatellia bacterium]HMX28293.1 hypothetical protein [Blastocatellia bacterium]HMZ18751.1 hypothetical protein [Blastocatellia bacterium]HNG30828.1 hypothetical protein [Blastocatellia bacterium]
MPDGDKFERQLRGKGWRKVYRLACRNEDPSELVRLAHNATQHALNDGLECPKLEEIIVLASRALRNPLFASVDYTDREYELAQQLEALADSQLSYPGTRLAIEAAKVVFLEIGFQGQTTTIEQIRRRISEKFKERVIDSQFLARIRDGVQEKTGRSNSEQSAWEERFIQSVISYKQTPRRIQSQPVWTSDRLNQPIPVMEA